jgi:hypothetical protein
LGALQIGVCLFRGRSIDIGNSVADLDISGTWIVGGEGLTFLTLLASLAPSPLARGEVSDASPSQGPKGVQRLTCAAALYVDDMSSRRTVLR